MVGDGLREVVAARIDLGFNLLKEMEELDELSLLLLQELLAGSHGGFSSDGDFFEVIITSWNWMIRILIKGIKQSRNSIYGSNKVKGKPKYLMMEVVVEDDGGETAFIGHLHGFETNELHQRNG